ncbi:peptide chain release factor PrfB3, chloroplastic isoform X2 [Cornus florida]|uniref:peptide chain release factor PrfB3, chloroplastic isoform X2 n=1 Tax=Cornus florida TaxID=4283 RepID=UPI00289F48DA|nr:peptide chain release factor PrfB3, chloroplastic isoform X2 [Cornus florida]
MAKTAAKPVCARISGSNAPFSSKWKASKWFKLRNYPISSTIRASQSMDDKNKVYKELGMFSLRKKIEDAVLRAEMLAPTALELEQASHIKQEEMIREHNLWDDLTKSNEMLVKLADTAKVVDALKDLTYKAEEVKLITQLAEMDAINYGLFKQAYTASVDVNKFLDKYEMSKLLSGPYDMEGASLTIRAGTNGIFHEMWAEQLLRMYLKWAGKQNCGGWVVEKYPSENGGFKSATIEFESNYAYGYLLGERGVHQMISSHDGPILHEAHLAAVDVIPLFLETAPDLLIPDEDLMISSTSSYGEEQSQTKSAVCIQHIPTGLRVQSSGERSHFANKMKALNRLKAKLLIVLRDQGISSVRNIDRDGIVDMWHQEARRYVFHPYKLVQDVKTGIQLPDLNSVLDGNIEPLIAANINSRQTCEMV